MAGLADTLAELITGARGALVADPAGGLSAVHGFGSNPGALKMWLQLPDGLAPGAPLVVVLHGCGQTADGYAAGAGWVELAGRYGFALLCPEQAHANNANRCFNWFEDTDIARGSGEAASIAQMVRYAVAKHDLDPRRVFVTGLSAGGAMTAVMLAAYPELFAAGAVIAGLPYGVASGTSGALSAMRRMPELSAQAWGDKVRAAAPPPQQWPAISIWHGDADATVTPTAGEALARQWCDVHGVSRLTHEHTGLDRHAHQTWRRPDGEIAVELHRISGLGHGAPICELGDEGCGSPAPWILETGLSSSLQIVRFWQLVEAHPGPRRTASEKPDGGVIAQTIRSAPSSLDVGETIARALRGAGLLR